MFVAFVFCFSLVSVMKGLVFAVVDVCLFVCALVTCCLPSCGGGKSLFVACIVCCYFLRVCMCLFTCFGIALFAK